MITLLQALEWPLAALLGIAAASMARRRRISLVQAYLLAIAPGVILTLALAVFGPSNAGPHEQPWQALLLWCAWAALGTEYGRRTSRRPRTITRLDLSSHE